MRLRCAEQDADLLIAARVGLPRELPFTRFTVQAGWTAKLPDVIQFVGGRAVAWVDDSSIVVGLLNGALTRSGHPSSR